MSSCPVVTYSSSETSHHEKWHDGNAGEIHVTNRCIGGRVYWSKTVSMVVVVIENSTCPGRSYMALIRVEISCKRLQMSWLRTALQCLHVCWSVELEPHWAMTHWTICFTAVQSIILIQNHFISCYPMWDDTMTCSTPTWELGHFIFHPTLYCQFLCCILNWILQPEDDIKWAQIRNPSISHCPIMMREKAK